MVPRKWWQGHTAPPSQSQECEGKPLIDQAGKYPVRTSLQQARFALHWLADAGLIPLQEAADRFEKLKNNQFKP